jgi:hypothetical protein
MMSADYFLAFFLLFAASAVFLWLLGAATFYRPQGWSRSFARHGSAMRCSLGSCKSGISSFRLTRVSL